MNEKRRFVLIASNEKRIGIIASGFFVGPSGAVSFSDLRDGNSFLVAVFASGSWLRLYELYDDESWENGIVIFGQYDRG